MTHWQEPVKPASIVEAAGFFRGVAVVIENQDSSSEQFGLLGATEPFEDSAADSD